MNLSYDRIARLEKIGFKWKFDSYDTCPMQYCRKLIVAFKEESEFGHCNAPQT